MTSDVDQNGEFKVPKLRNVVLTAPYVHNGMFKTLRELVYDDDPKVIPDSLGRDAQLRDPLRLTFGKIHDIEQPLLSLSGDRFAPPHNKTATIQ